MISLIGNNGRQKNDREDGASVRRRTRWAFTFFEVLVAVIILASGIALIYKALLISLDYERYISIRLYAMNLLNDRVNQMVMDYERTKQPPLFKTDDTQTVTLNHQNITFTFTTGISRSPQVDNLLQADAHIFWNQRGKTFRLTRYATLSVIQ